MSDKKELPVEIIEQPPAEIEIDKKALIKARKATEEKEIARIRQQFNTRTMRVKARLLAEAGIEIEKWGVKMIGHGRLHCAGDNADRAVAAIQEDIDRLLTENPKVNANVIAELRATQLRFNKQIIEVGQSHLEAAKEAGSKGGSNDMRIAFPAGQPVVVAVSPAPNVNDKEKALTDAKPTG
jgi:hypothetical protein